MTLNIRVIAPDKTVWSASSEEVILPSSTGQLGILQGHIPLLTALDIGVMRVRVKKSWKPIVLFGGFAEIEKDRVTILVNAAEETHEINAEECQKNLEESIDALSRVISNKEKIEATQNIRKARARLQALASIS
jgi:F-type H+-transporting ATPase subunit epsilon|uniref:ATP synthase CF1 epsilon subunit n=1 Tax=Thorea hispida TaxID=202687 RepID=A0A1C9CAB1_9FLOR|nr:ATP synthase CF1 epsilon subunit [Thorea hispida]AOM65323.1 ATP synthase CF1 epsilon subunit [Thorea hispida]ARX95883.1 ATP synthase CF1 epsilon subunit [Thorea hispida]UNJ79168.1 ATP synthase CF1 epsilon subunit [Thorea hispida]